MLPYCERVASIPRAKYLPSHIRGIPVPTEPKTIGEHLRKRRLALRLLQRESSVKLGVSTVTLSRWECNKVYPTWRQQPTIACYLGFDPFTDPTLGRPRANETPNVAFLSPVAPNNIGQIIMQYATVNRKTREQVAQELGLSVKTIWNWFTGRRRPSKALRQHIESLNLLERAG